MALLIQDIYLSLQKELLLYPSNRKPSLPTMWASLCKLHACVVPSPLIFHVWEEERENFYFCFEENHRCILSPNKQDSYYCQALLCSQIVVWRKPQFSSSVIMEASGFLWSKGFPSFTHTKVRVTRSPCETHKTLQTQPQQNSGQVQRVRVAQICGSEYTQILVNHNNTI